MVVGESMYTNSSRFDWAAQDDILLLEFVVLAHCNRCFGEEVNGQFTSSVLCPCQEVDVPKGFGLDEQIYATD